MDFGAPNRHFQARKFKCPITFLKISIRALHFWIKTWIFIQLIWFLIPHNNEGVPNRIYKEFRKRSSKRSSYILSNFEPFQIWSRNWNFCSWFHRLTNWHSGAPFWAPFFQFLKSMKCQHSLEEKINVIAILETFLVSFENTNN